MGKSAEELYNEDMNRTKNEVEAENLESEVEEYKKPEAPHHIKLTVAILKRSLNFLPSNEKDRKLLVLEILRDGLEIIREFEDELLPMVHLIWHPLVGRFKETDSPVIINYSFLLLTTMARISKEFIRMRTIKDVLPSILNVLKNLSKESYLKDRGSAYSFAEKDIEKTSDAVFIYLSDKQPLPLQREAVNFFKLLILYDPTLQNTIKDWSKEKSTLECKKNVDRIFEENVGENYV
ncbi:hypothetical protein WA026_004092 [Henosepilachna vigintioctopunctata]|uniref:TTI1 C-terminal TPR domain-containing protein n=1 Tax=Henosepilachna vigintioctopunctata TaxID=420089 RepID=A0AAW1UF92_9CUCU